MREGEEKAFGMEREKRERERLRVEVIEELVSARDRGEYLERQKMAAVRLNLSISSIQRLVRTWERSGAIGLRGEARSDRGEHRVGEEWQKFIERTYREGNQGSRRMSRAQVAVRVKVRAQEMGEARYPSHMTVYRIFEVDPYGWTVF